MDKYVFYQITFRYDIAERLEFDIVIGKEVRSGLGIMRKKSKPLIV